MTLAAPILWPIAMAAMMLLFWRHPAWQRLVAVFGSAVHVGLGVNLVLRVLSGPVSLSVGGWRAPFGIALYADRLAAAMVLISAVIGLASVLYSFFDIDQRRESFGFHPLVQVLLGGVCGAFLTADFFNLYVWFEVMLMASFVLLALGGEKRQMMGALQYVSLNLLASMVFLVAMGVLYGLVGTLNMADVSSKLHGIDQPGLIFVLSGLLLIAFGTKAAVFPVFAWLPSSYHTPPTVVTALFAGLLTKVGVYALLRTTSLIYVPHAPAFLDALLWIAILTMVIGVLGAIAQQNFRRVLSFHIISQIGYMVLGVALFSAASLSATVFYILHHIIVKTNLFFIAGLAKRVLRTEELDKMGGLYQRVPLLAGLFLISAMSLSGIPPLSGFWAKLFLLRSALLEEAWLSITVALIVGLLTLFSMLKIWNEAFWKTPPEEKDSIETERSPGKLRWGYMPVVALAMCTVSMGVFAGHVLEYADSAAQELLQPQIMQEVVLGAQK